MSDFLRIVTERPATREKATGEQIELVRSKLTPGTTRPIPDCCLNDQGEYDWNNIRAMVWVRGMEDKTELTEKEVLKSVGLHNVRDIMKEIYFYYWDVASRENVEAHWERIFERVESFDKCECCGSKKVVHWQYCASCGYDFVNKKDGYDYAYKLSVLQLQEAQSEAVAEAEEEAAEDTDENPTT